MGQSRSFSNLEQAQLVSGKKNKGAGPDAAENKKIASDAILKEISDLELKKSSLTTRLSQKHTQVDNLLSGIRNAQQYKAAIKTIYKTKNDLAMLMSEIDQEQENIFHKKGELESMKAENQIL